MRRLKHDRFVLLNRERDLKDSEILLLSVCTKNYDELGLAYRLKQDFFGIYDAQSPGEAQGRYVKKPPHFSVRRRACKSTSRRLLLAGLECH